MNETAPKNEHGLWNKPWFQSACAAVLAYELIERIIETGCDFEQLNFQYSVHGAAEIAAPFVVFALTGLLWAAMWKHKLLLFSDKSIAIGAVAGIGLLVWNWEDAAACLGGKDVNYIQELNGNWCEQVGDKDSGLIDVGIGDANLFTSHTQLYLDYRFDNPNDWSKFRLRRALNDKGGQPFDFDACEFSLTADKQTIVPIGLKANCARRVAFQKGLCLMQTRSAAPAQKNDSR